MVKLSKSAKVAQDIRSTAERLGWIVSVRESVMSISKTFEKNDVDAYVKAYSQWYGILSLMPTTRVGTIWGSGDGGVGGSHAIKTGRFTMNQSGCSKRVLTALSNELTLSSHHVKHVAIKLANDGRYRATFLDSSGKKTVSPLDGMTWTYSDDAHDSVQRVHVHATVEVS